MGFPLFFFHTFRVSDVIYFALLFYWFLLILWVNRYACTSPSTAITVRAGSLLISKLELYVCIYIFNFMFKAWFKYNRKWFFFLFLEYFSFLLQGKRLMACFNALIPSPPPPFFFSFKQKSQMFEARICGDCFFHTINW